MPAAPHTHPLVSYVRRTFGDRFASVVLVGYGGQEGPRELLLKVSVASRGEGIHGQLLKVSGDLPHGQEPLLLAALLKLLLSRGSLSPELEFEMQEVLAALSWPEAPGARVDDGDRVIRKYVGLTYTAGGEGDGGAGSGMYALVTGYDLEEGMELADHPAARIIRRVHFHPRFVDGLKDSRVVFAGIDFGRLRRGD